MTDKSTMTDYEIIGNPEEDFNLDAKKSSKKTLYLTIFLCILFGAVASQKYGGLFLIFPLLGAFIYAPYMLLRSFVIKPNYRNWRLMKIALWAVTLAIVFGIHHQKAASRLTEANLFVQAVTEYKEKIGRYPDETQAREIQKILGIKDYIHYYFISANADSNTFPHIVYQNTFIPFSSCIYKQSDGSWPCSDSD